MTRPKDPNKALTEWRYFAARRPLYKYLTKKPQFECMIEQAPKEWMACNENAIEYTRFRMRELWLEFGYVSPAVGSIVRLEAEALADADYLRHQAMVWFGQVDTEHGRAGAERAINALRLAHNIGVLARGHAEASRTLCEKEARAKRDQQPGQGLAEELESDDAPG